MPSTTIDDDLLLNWVIDLSEGLAEDGSDRSDREAWLNDPTGRS